MEKLESNFAEKKEKPQIDYVETEKGSVYTYLPDGRTQRFKKAANETYSPQDAIVFIPDWGIGLQSMRQKKFWLSSGKTNFNTTRLFWSIFISKEERSL